uniref:Ovule protein n=1 Tax=Ascaris lumbricoides TaxID=6252 RepID=A0A0M3IAQ2_ASCLU
LISYFLPLLLTVKIFRFYILRKIYSPGRQIFLCSTQKVDKRLTSYAYIQSTSVLRHRLLDLMYSSVSPSILCIALGFADRVSY